MKSNGLINSWKSLLDADPQKGATVDPFGKWKSRESLDTASREIAKSWKALGLKERQIVALHAPNGSEWIIAFIACLHASAVLVPIDFNLSAEDALKIARKTGASLFHSLDESLIVKGLNPHRFRSSKIRLGKLTSGTIGKPKLLYFSDAELIADGQRIIDVMGIKPDDINMGVIPWGHSYGLGNLVVPFALQGTPLTWSPGPLPNEISTSIESTGATLLPAVPTLLKALANSSCPATQLASLRLVISAGSRLLPEIAQSFHAKFSLIPHNFYGSSETGAICYDSTGEDSLSGASIGKPMSGVRLEKASYARFYVSSASVYTYRNRKRSSNGYGRCFMVDRGQIDGGGNLTLGNRVKGFAKIAGKRVALNEIEDHLKSIPGIQDALVIEHSDQEDSQLGACIETDFDGQETSTVIRSKLPRRLRPSIIKCYRDFPTTARGKINVAKLKADLERDASRLKPD